VSRRLGRDAPAPAQLERGLFPDGAAEPGRWAASHPLSRHVGILLGLAAAVGAAVAGPQIVAMAQQAAAAAPNPGVLAGNYVSYGVALPQMFTPSPRLSAFGLDRLAGLFHDGIATEGMPTFGVSLTVLALLGAAIGRCRGRERMWLGLWLGGCLPALGPVLYLGSGAHTPLPVRDDGQTMSLLMPYTWFVRLEEGGGHGGGGRQCERFEGRREAAGGE